MASNPQDATANPAEQALQNVLAAQKKAFRARAPLSYRERIDALDTLLEGMVRYQEDFVESLKQDFGNRARHETRLLEIFPIIDEIRHTRRHLRKWMKPKKVSSNWQFSPSRARIIYQPLGVVGIMGAWNYQLLLTLSPLVCALAAGNHAMIKPSEMAPITADLMKKMIAEIFPEDFVTVVTGDVSVSSAFSALPFDHLIFTGSGRIGKIVMQAASKNLTPVTLELGGKSPALVHADYSQERAAERITSGKFWNAGQTCVAPDYALVQTDQYETFIKAAEANLKKRFPKIVDNPDYTRIINTAGYERQLGIIEDARSKGARVIQINQKQEDCNAENRVVPPTILADVTEDMQVLQEEIFGPILPVIKYKTVNEAIDYINVRDRPLALYYFDNKKSRIDHVLNHTTSGGVTVNDVIFHLVQNNLPFGGVGPSGMGAYHGIDGFETFSKKKGVFIQSWLVGTFFAKLLYPSYGKLSDWLVSVLIFRRAKTQGKR